MKILNRGRLVILLILVAVALVTSAAILGGIEWAFASLGAMVLVGVVGIGIYTLSKALRRSRLSLEIRWFGSEGGNTDNRIAQARPISRVDKRIILRHIDELFTIGREQTQEKSAEGLPISEQDKRLVMEHIDEFFYERSKDK